VKGLLLRVGIDSSCGKWNAPVDPETNDFTYIPIPEAIGRFQPGKEITYNAFEEALARFSSRHHASEKIELPHRLRESGCHVDPNFETLTYGDQDSGRGIAIKSLQKGDFIAFFSSMKPIKPCEHKLIYALIGLYVVDNTRQVKEISQELRDLNVHGIRRTGNENDWIVFADPHRSGRFTHCLPIGERRNGAYRVTEDLLHVWGGLSVKDGYIQRSVKPPFFNYPERFLLWLEAKNIELIRMNNWK